MIELARFAVDFIGFFAAFALGVFVQQAFNLGSWFVPVSLLPCALWAWWRGALPRESLPKILSGGACLCLFFELGDLFQIPIVFQVKILMIIIVCISVFYKSPSDCANQDS